MASKAKHIHTPLIEGCRRGDPQAQYEIYKLYSKAMLNTSLRITGNLPEAEDVLQESFLDAFTKIGSYRGDASFGAWLKRIVVNKSINALQRKKVELVSLNGVEKADTEVIREEPEYSIDSVMTAVEQLPTGYRVVFSLYLLEGYDHKEISDLLGISVSGSKSQLNRAKRKVREILNAKSYV